MINVILLLLLLGILGFVVALPFIALGCIWADHRSGFKNNYTLRFYCFLFDVKYEREGE